MCEGVATVNGTRVSGKSMSDDTNGVGGNGAELGRCMREGPVECLAEFGMDSVPHPAPQRLRCPRSPLPYPHDYGEKSLDSIFVVCGSGCCFLRETPDHIPPGVTSGHSIL
jgi:hypothetical protein